MKFKKPNQHGVWAMLIMPFLFGIFAGHLSWMHVLFIVSWFLIFFAADNFLFFMKQRRKQRGYMMTAVSFITVAVIMILPVIIKLPVLILFFLSMIPFGIINVLFAKQRNERHILNDLSAVVIFSTAGMISYYIGVRQLDLKAIVVFTFSMLYFTGTILYVKTMIREKKSSTYKWLSFGYHILLVSIAMLVHPLLGTAMLPSLLRAVLFYGRNYKPMKIGIVEIANACFITWMVGIYFYMTT